MLPPTIDILVPFWGLAGGVIKLLDYADHAQRLGIATTLWAPPKPTESNDPIASLPVYERLLSSGQVRIRHLDDLEFAADATVLFTEPTHHRLIELAHHNPLGERLIHLVQGTRHATPNWNDGLNYRLLHRPMTRIAVSDQVANAIVPIVNTRYDVHTIVEGHDWEYFSGRPTPNSATSESGTRRLRVLYTTWKSDLGDRIANAASDGDDFAFVAVRTPLAWPTLRNRYHGADVLLCTPGVQEGFYLPGLEAMAARAVVVTALVGGNEAYIRADVNALVVPYDDVAAHLRALRTLRDDAELRNRLLAGGVETLRAHTLDRERAAFAEVLSAIGI